MHNIVKRDKTDITVDKLKQIFPARKSAITEELAEYVDAANKEEDFSGDEFLNTLVTYSDVLENGVYSIKEYVRAVKFCAYLVSENDNTIEAYKKARADDDFVKTRVNDPAGSKGYNALSSAATRYRQSKLVRDLLTVSQMPLYLMFQGERYRAVATLAEEMKSAAYSKDRIAAADKLLTHVKPPENMEVELKVGPNKEAKDLGMQLTEQLAASVQLQRKMLEMGVDLKDATKLGIQLNDVEEAEIVDGNS